MRIGVYTTKQVQFQSSAETSAASVDLPSYITLPNNNYFLYELPLHTCQLYNITKIKMMKKPERSGTSCVGYFKVLSPHFVMSHDGMTSYCGITGRPVCMSNGSVVRVHTHTESHTHTRPILLPQPPT